MIALVLASTTVFADSPAPQMQLTDLDRRVSAIFVENCALAGCHSGSNPQLGLKLTEDAFYARTVNQPSAEVPEMMRVKPGEPENSYLVQKVMGAEGIIGLPMPFGRDALLPEEKTTIIEWVKSLKGVDTSRLASDSPDPLLPFPGWKVINTPTARMIDKGDWLFLIGHRFANLSNGYDNLFGLDGAATMFLNMGYAITDKVFVNIGRSNAFDDVELNVKYGILDQFPGKFPLAAAVQANLNWVSLAPPQGESRLRSEVLSPSLQAILSSEVYPGYSINVVPGVLLNPNVTRAEEDPLITLGLAGRIHLAGNISLIGEWVPILSGYSSITGFGNRFDSWGGGFEIFVRGHVFELFVANAAGLTSSQYMNGGDFDVRDGDMRIGFNIFRQLQF